MRLHGRSQTELLVPLPQVQQDFQQVQMTNIAVTCTWGEGPDVMLHVSDSELETPRSLSLFIGLDAADAVQLGEQLIEAGNKAHSMSEESS